MNHSNADLLGVKSLRGNQEYSEAVLLEQAVDMISKTNWRKKDLVEESQYVPTVSLKDIKEAKANFANKFYAGEIITRMFETQRRVRRN